MSNELKYLVIHCSDTPPEMKVKKSDLEQWHKSPFDNPDGSVTYLGKKYKDRDSLPDAYINGKPIRLLSGRGWTRLGYSDMIHRDGTIENITPYNKDNIIDPWEITNGAVGVNAISRHIVLVGGWRGKQRSLTAPFFELFTEAQFMSLVPYLKDEISRNRDIKIIGHRDVPKAFKTCPNFEVSKFCVLAGIPKENIGI